MTDEAAVTQLQIRFITKQPQYAIPDTPYAIDANVSTTALNTLIKTILSENSSVDLKRVEFDFLVCGELVRTPLLEHLKSRGGNTESTVDVEYLERVPAPKPQDCLTHDDWVAAVSCRNSWIVTGCYDNSVHIWSSRGEHKLAIPGHTSPVKAVAWVSLSDTTAVFISGSHDQSALVWEWDLASNAVSCVVACRGHDKSVECVAVSPDGSRFCTGSWDNTIKIWSAQLQDEDESTSKKARVEQGKSRSALSTLSGHRSAVSGVSWLGGSAALASCSWDHTLRLWDLELGAPTRTIAANKSFFCLDWAQHATLLATASADRVVRIYDPRSAVDAPCVSARGHTGWVSAVRWAPNRDNLFLSAGHDMLLKMWDIRSPKVALYELSGHTDKVMCCEWAGRLLLSGGADNTLRIYKAKVPQHVDTSSTPAL